MEEVNELKQLKEELALIRKERTNLKRKITLLSNENKRLSEMLEQLLDNKCNEITENPFRTFEKILDGTLPLVTESPKATGKNKNNNNNSRKKASKQSRKANNSKSHEDKYRNISVVYFVNCEQAKAMKIGTSKDVRNRLSSIQTGNPFKLSLIGCVPGTITEEKILHEYFSEIRAVGEWFYTNDRLMRYSIDVTTAGEFINPFEWFKPNLCHLKTEPYVLKLIKRKRISFEQSEEIINQAEAYISSLLPASANP